MKHKAFQVRLDPHLHEAVDFFARETGTSMNKLVIEAIDAYVRRLAVQLDAELVDTLRRVSKYALSPECEELDLQAFVEAEATMHDPAEGTVVAEVDASSVGKKVEQILAGLG